MTCTMYIKLVPCNVDICRSFSWGNPPGIFNQPSCFPSYGMFSLWKTPLIMLLNMYENVYIMVKHMEKW